MTSSESKITISGGPPYGMRIKGGSEFGQPISVENASTEGKASSAGVKSGDILLSINGHDVTACSHDAAKKLILDAKDVLHLTVKRGSGSITSQSSRSSTGASLTTSAAPKDSYRPPQSAAGGSSHAAPAKVVPTAAMADFSNTQTTTSFAQPSTKPTSYGSTSSAPKASTGSGMGNLAGSRDYVKYTPYDNDSQQAQVISTTSAMCASCMQPIGTEKHVKLGDRIWHTEHFVCTSCQKKLASVGFFEENRHIYCKECYASIVSPKCFTCQKPCIDRYVSAGDRSYHNECFCCNRCKKSLAGVPYNNHDNKPHCIACVSELMSVQCACCQKPIKPGEQFVEAAEKQYHSSCFKCTVCSTDLTLTGRFVMREGKPQCPSHI